MSKPKWKDTEPGKRESLPELAELKFDEANRAILLLEQAHELQDQIGADPKGKKEGSGLKGRLFDLKTDLESIQISNGLEGLRHNRLVYICSMQDGRPKKVNMIELGSLLMERAGVSAKLFKECVADATPEPGDPYYKRELPKLK